MPNLRQMEIVTDKDKLNVDIQQTCMNYKTIKNWAYILHDKDDTRPHYHIYLHFGTSSVDTKLVASWFQVPENFVNKIKGRKVDMLMYLTHSNSTQQHKHQFSHLLLTFKLRATNKNINIFTRKDAKLLVNTAEI